jgi:hypothetical protein
MGYMKVMRLGYDAVNRVAGYGHSQCFHLHD